MNKKIKKDNENFIIITTFIGSGMSDINFFNQRAEILRLSTIPSINDMFYFTELGMGNVFNNIMPIKMGFN